LHAVIIKLTISEEVNDLQIPFVTHKSDGGNNCKLPRPWRKRLSDSVHGLVGRKTYEAITDRKLFHTIL